MKPNREKEVSEWGQRLGVTGDDLKEIERARRKESLQVKIIGIASVIAAFLGGAGFSAAIGTDVQSQYPFAVVPFAGLWKTRVRSLLIIILASAFAALMGYLMMALDWQGRANGGPYYGSFRRPEADSAK